MLIELKEGYGLIVDEPFFKGRKSLEEKGMRLATSAEVSALKKSGRELAGEVYDFLIATSEDFRRLSEARWANMRRDAESFYREKVDECFFPDAKTEYSSFNAIDMFATANVGLYGVKDGKTWFSLGESEEFEQIFEINNFDTLENIMWEQKKYRLSKRDSLWVAERQKSGELPVFDLETELKLSDNYWEEHLDGVDNHHYYIPICVKKHKKLSGNHRTLAETAFGKGNEFDKAIKQFAKGRTPIARIMVLSPDQVRKIATEGETLAYGCILVYKPTNWLHTNAFYFSYRYDALLGVPHK